MPKRDLVVLESPNGYVSLAKGKDAKLGVYLEPLECMWQFASPFAKRENRLVDDFFTYMCSDLGNWDVIVLSGLFPAGEFFERLIRCFESRFRLVLLGETQRIVSSLTGGADSFLARRNRFFRRNLRRSVKRAYSEGIEYDLHGNNILLSDCDALYQRILNVEIKSHKGAANAGIVQPPMGEFYKKMIPRLVAKRALRVIFARREEQDIGYIFGGMQGEAFRGLQMSFDARYSQLSVGNILQMRLIEELGGENVVVYDLGSAMDYKRHWGEGTFKTVSIGVIAN